jgi:putative flippase GtrA
MAQGRAPVSTSIQFLRFLVVGALNTLFGYSVFAGLVLAGVRPVPALVLTYVVGVLFNFMTTRRFVFSRSARTSLARFIGAYVVIYFFNLGLYKLFEAADASPLVAQALCLPVVAVFSFLIFKFQVFRDPP